MDKQIHVEPMTSPTSGIQEAIDSLPETGGRVHIPAGRWHLSRSICLPSGVSLVGEGPATVLHIWPLKIARLATAVRKGGRVLTLTGKVPYRVGQEIGVSDEKLNGWWGSHGIIEAINGNRVRLSTKFNRGLSVANDAKAVSLFPAVTGMERPTSNSPTSRFAAPGATRASGGTSPTVQFTWYLASVSASQM